MCERQTVRPAAKGDRRSHCRYFAHVVLGLLNAAWTPALRTSAWQMPAITRGTGDALAGSQVMIELPAPGYPLSEQSLIDWFRQKYGREPTEREVGTLMSAMAEQGSTPSDEGPQADPEARQTDPGVAPTTKR